MRFTNKIAVITGAAGGIGYATCERFAQEGADIAALDLPGADFSKLTHTVEAVGGRLLCIEMNVTQAGDWQTTVAEIVQAWGGVDILINNAGIAGSLGRFEDCTLEDFDRTLSVNVRGVFMGMQAVIPTMRSRGGGVIVNVSSVSGERGNPRVMPYVTSKHALNGLTKCAALDLIEYGIRVNAVSPAPTNTNMIKAAEKILIDRSISASDARKALSAGIPMGRYGEPTEIAAVIAFLCSADASFLTGAIVNADGGMLAY